jgi:hypothetical protein
MANYYAPAFEDMQTTTIQMTLRQAQIELDHAEGATREVLCEVIRGAASELLFRYRESMRNLP